MFVVIFLSVIFFLLIYVYVNGIYNENYWKKRGVKFHSQNKMLGHFWDYVTGRRPLFEVFGDLYKEYENEPAVGIGSFFVPSLYVRDVRNIEHILQTDFNSFHHRGIESFDGDQLSENILFMNGPKWKLVRQNMTPLFTGTKLKNMFYIMDKSSQDFVAYLKQHTEKQNGDAFDTLTYFCSATLTASIFGIGTESIFDSPFVKVARAAVAPSLALDIKFTLASISPGLVKLLRLKIFEPYEEFFIGAMKEVLKKRERENIKRHDFADIALSIQKNGIMKDPTTGCEMEPTVGLLSAQAFFFFIAGVAPSATVIFCALLEMGENPEILRKVHEEIDEAFEKNGCSLTYDVVAELQYLEKVISETLRKYPPVGFLSRQCTNDTVLPVGNIKVTKGTKVFTPLFHIHRDPKFYPNPEVFDPERFNKQGQQINDSFYMPFGKGNRLCIGSRFARIQVKACLTHLLRHFSVRTVNYELIKFNKEPVAVRPINVDVEFIPRNI